jgi:hypothetical protein
MKQLFNAAMAALLFATLSPASFAIESNQVRGEIVEVNPQSREIRLRVTESGENRAAQPGSVTEFYVPRDTSINYDLDRTRYSIYARNEDGLADLKQGDTVLLNFEEVSNRRQAILIIAENPRDPLLRDRLRREGRVTARDGTTSAPSGTAASSSSATGGTMTDRNDRDMSASVARTELPASASPLPALALAGLVFAGLGATLRLRRRR